MNKKDIDNLDWSNAFRDELHDTELTPPVDGWERLETSLSATPLPRRSGIYTLKWVASIAAILLIGWVAADFWIADKIVEHVTSTEELYSKLESTTSTQKVEDIVNPIKQEPQNEITSYTSKNKEIAKTDKSTTINSEDTTHKPLVSTKTSNHVEDSNEQKSNAEIENYDDSKTHTEQKDQYIAYNTTVQKPLINTAKRRTSISVNVAGMSDGVDPATSSLDYDVAPNDGGGSCSLDESILFSNSYVDVRGVQMYNRSEVKHRQPITFALNAERGLSNTFALESGVSYTALISDVHFNNLSVTEVQKIHLIGIPLRVNTYIYKGDFLQLYAGVGGTTEYCVAATIGGQLTNEKRWHFSANAALGAQYMFNDWLGLYVEPDFSYYFSQTNLKTIRNEYPLSFNLRCGLRFKL